ncbi:hypothetical protein [Ancylobacter vacuolatus]|uniref:Uncharacterized protein n=1 Tax=Ancylobacter vacuolatus TaxID=223389 RepID=A0ABU0DG81_9HYPH|nr:hypothetical protein [Ancylobacter vacuolatus]MDQ0347412.1 hypothetical protein [Ancylobacter vacuolatus]
MKIFGSALALTGAILMAGVAMAEENIGSKVIDPSLQMRVKPKVQPPVGTDAATRARDVPASGARPVAPPAGPAPSP